MIDAILSYRNCRESGILMVIGRALNSFALTGRQLNRHRCSWMPHGVVSLVAGRYATPLHSRGSSVLDGLDYCVLDMKSWT